MSNDFLKWLTHASSLYRTKYPSEYTLRSKKDQPEDGEDWTTTMVRNHPLTSLQDLEKKKSTHLLFTGGKFLWNDEPTKEPVYGGEDNQKGGTFSSDHKPFIEAAPRLLGRQATYEDLFWLSYQKYLKGAMLERPTMKHNVCLTEVVSKPLFKFFIDLDLEFVRPHPDAASWKDFVKNVCKSVGDAMLQAFPTISEEKDVRGIMEFTVMYTPDYQQVHEKGMYKRGLHLVWPRLIVNQDRAETLVRLIDERLTLKVPRDMTENTWKDALDLSVYRSGLRLVGCIKSKKCPVCYHVLLRPFHGKIGEAARIIHSDMCHDRFPKGHVFLGKESMYKIQHIARMDGDFFSAKDCKARVDSHILRDGQHVFDFSFRNLSSIRAPSSAKETEGFVMPLHLRAPLQEDGWRVWPTTDPETGLPLMVKRKAPDPNRDRSGDKTGVHLKLSFTEIHTLTNILRTFNPRYAKILVDGAYAFPLATGAKDTMLPPKSSSHLPQRALFREIWVKVKGEGAHDCLVKQGTHKTNTIRFHLRPDGEIVQSCWSTKPTTSNGKPCCRQTTRGLPQYQYRFPQAHIDVLVDLFTRGESSTTTVSSS